MSKDWKPGDLALARITPKVDGRDRVGGWSPIIRDNVGSWASGVAAGRVVLDSNIVELRRLVVIDPEDREQVEHLLRAMDYWSEPFTEVTFDRMQTALREFANPTPPIEEPKVWLAVVEDVDGMKWFTHRDDPSIQWDKPWYCQDLNEYRDWSDIAAVRVLSEGVTP